MKKFILLLLFVPRLAFGQQEQWTTFNITGKLNKDWSIATEAEQRYSNENSYIRYFHYDAGMVRNINSHVKLGFFYREIYEIKKEQRVVEIRPHTDAFITQNEHWKYRVRLEYQMKEFDEDILRFRVRPTYELHRWNQADPYIQSELNFTKYGFTRNRFNTGLTFHYGKLTTQPGFLLESLHKGAVWSHTTAIWINNKISF